jgi:hypothetical protein
MRARRSTVERGVPCGRQEGRGARAQASSQGTPKDQVWRAHCGAAPSGSSLFGLSSEGEPPHAPAPQCAGVGRSALPAGGHGPPPYSMPRRPLALSVAPLEVQTSARASAYLELFPGRERSRGAASAGRFHAAAGAQRPRRDRESPPGPLLCARSGAESWHSPAGPQREPRVGAPLLHATPSHGVRRVLDRGVEASAPCCTSVWTVRFVLAGTWATLSGHAWARWPGYLRGDPASPVSGSAPHVCPMSVRRVCRPDALRRACVCGVASGLRDRDPQGSRQTWTRGRSLSWHAITPARVWQGPARRAYHVGMTTTPEQPHEPTTMPGGDPEPAPVNPGEDPGVDPAPDTDLHEGDS